MAHFRERYNAEAKTVNKASNPVTTLFGVAAITAQASGSLADMYTDLATVAPDAIRTQVEEVRDNIKQQNDLMTRDDPSLTN